MSFSEGVSWRFIESIVQHWRGSDARLTEMCLLTGGLVNQTLSVKLKDQASAVIKVSDHRVNLNLAREARELARLGSLGIPVPEVYDVQTASLEQPHSFLVMQHVPGVSFRELRPKLSPDHLDAIELELCEIVLKMHNVVGPSFGRNESDVFDQWPAFYRSLVDPVLSEADKLQCLPGKTFKLIHRIHDHLERLIRTDDPPRLLHGDLWAANIICNVGEDQRWRIEAIIDPELRFGHAEAELAYMDLFKTITPAFKQRYAKTYPLGNDYHRRRKPVYQLYGLINQLQMNGPAYAPPLIEAVDKLSGFI